MIYLYSKCSGVSNNEKRTAAGEDAIPKTN